LIDENDLNEYVEKHIEIFHNNRIMNISNLKLTNILKHKNPYLFRAKIDPMFLLNIGHLYITTGPHMDSKDRFYVVLYKEQGGIPSENLDKFKTDLKNRDVFWGKGVGIDDLEFLELVQ